MNNIHVTIEGYTKSIKDLKIKYKHVNEVDMEGEEKREDKRGDITLNKNNNEGSMFNSDKKSRP